ncbi:NADAR family protein [Paenibacillus sp. sgz500958]|uniref:NADAR family protein n=1 Tax=Paenibacillus sp. sgz500958 TaxID=3242475 RepID=UPI0036D2DB57
MFNLLFYETNKPYGCFSNFAKYPIEVEGKLWPTSEHYFQAAKFAGTPHEEELRLVEKPMDVARMGRERSRPLRADWEQIKDDVMRKAVGAKVEQYPHIKSILLSTGSCSLIEHTSNDSYWADGGDGTGKNMLGVILMEIRSSLPEYTGEFYLPQWIAYPDIHPYDIFWRMGMGEGYVMEYGQWFYGLSKEAQEEYNHYFVPPREWEGK